jgi:hypothetical protein
MLFAVVVTVVVATRTVSIGTKTEPALDGE